MAIKTISQFDAAIPASDDKILFEQNGEGKSASIEDIVNTCSLTYEEITATNPVPDLTNKVASAGALNNTMLKGNFTIIGTSTTMKTEEVITLSQPITNFKYIMVKIFQGYETIALSFPTKLWSTIYSTYSFSHGNPGNGYGCEGILVFSNSNVTVKSPIIKGWSFEKINIIGVN